MLRYLYADQLGRFPRLAETMFRDRADQFRTRLGWDVSVDENGFERDEYDELNPLYAIYEEPDGTHGGSIRFLPTTGRTMVNDVFGHLLGNGPICSPLIWESTRFCLSRECSPGVAAALMLAGGEFVRGFRIRHIAGVFDARMIRIYTAIGYCPEVLGGEGLGKDRISVGLWSFSEKAHARVARRAGIDLERSKLWFDQAFGTSAVAQTVLQRTG